MSSNWLSWKVELGDPLPLGSRERGQLEKGLKRGEFPLEGPAAQKVNPVLWESELPIA